MASDPTPLHLQQLSPQARAAAVYIVAAAREAGWPLIITSSRRSLAEQRELLAAGVTRTLRSAHLRGDAFDFDLWRTPRSAVPQFFWNALGPFGESIGLRWGGRFSGLYDPAHFELGR